MMEQRILIVLLAVVVVLLVALLAGEHGLFTPVAAQAPAVRAPIENDGDLLPQLRPRPPKYRSVIIDRYDSVAAAEKSMQLRMMEGFEIITVQVVPESVGDLESDENIRVANLFLAPINSAWVVVYGR